MNWLFESLISTSLISTDLMIWLVYHTLWGRKQRRKTWLVRTQALQILWDSVYILYARIHQFLPPLMVAIKVWKMPKRKVCLSHLGDNKKCLLGISVSNKYIPHKSISEESKVNPKCINENPIISIFALLWTWSSIFRTKISDECSVLWNQLN